MKLIGSIKSKITKGKNGKKNALFRNYWSNTNAL